MHDILPSSMIHISCVLCLMRGNLSSLLIIINNVHKIRLKTRLEYMDKSEYYQKWKFWFWVSVFNLQNLAVLIFYAWKCGFGFSESLIRSKCLTVWLYLACQLSCYLYSINFQPLLSIEVYYYCSYNIYNVLLLTFLTVCAADLNDASNHAALLYF